ncbi:MAG: hypothetical protein IKD46_03310 [Lentisphaeria bacterium]|nr:hypothetical protein [Lentisphaeria bacterium]
MKKQLWAGILAGCLVFSASAAEDFSGKLPQLAGQKIKTTWNAPSAAAVQNGTYTLAAVLPKEMVHYAGFRVNMTGDLSKEALRFDISSSTPEKSRALYIRCFDAQNKCVASWKTWSSPATAKTATVILAAEHNSHGLEWEPEMVKSASKTFTKIEFIIGHRGKAGTVYDAKFSKIGMCAIPKTATMTKTAVPAKLSSEGFEILGIPAKSAELRSSIGYIDNGRHYLLTRPQDHGKTGYLLLTDLDSGKTEQYFNPKEVRQGDSFGSILTSKGLFIYDQQGANVVVFDTKTRKYRNLGRPEPLAHHFMVYTEAPDGTVYLGGYPRATITSWNPKTGEFRNYGRMDPKESYLNQIATDKNGYVYCGIGSARANLVALDPKTGKVTQIIPEKMRKLGWGNAISGEDGYAYLVFGGFSAKMLNGKIVETNVIPAAPRKILAAKYGGRLWKFDDGTRVLNVDLYKNIVTYQGLNGKRRDIPFDYVSGGLHYTSMGGDGKGKVFGSTSHPMHFAEYDANSGKITDHGPHAIVSGGNFCNITYAKDGTVYMCEYAGGRLWKYDTTKAFDGGKIDTLPKIPGMMNVSEIHQIGKAQKGHFTLVSHRILLCYGDQENATFTFPLQVTKTGETHVNILAYEHGIYGTATFEFQGKSRKVNLQNIVNRSRMINMPPVFLKPGTYPLKVTVRSHGGDSRPMAGILGIAVTDSKLVLPKKKKIETNPKILGAWPQQVTRPRAVQVHPDGKHVVIAGYAGYGLCGGSFGIHNLATGKNSVLTDWLEGHSCITFRFDNNGDIVGGTDIAAPGGGHTVASKPAIFRIDWKTKKVAAHTEIKNVRYVAAVELWNGKLYAALSDSRVIVADPQTMKVERVFAANGLGTPVRNALMKSADNRLFLLQTNGISEFHPKSGDMVPRCRPLQGIGTAGTINNGYIYFACNVHFARWKIPAPLK